MNEFTTNLVSLFQEPLFIVYQLFNWISIKYVQERLFIIAEINNFKEYNTAKNE